MYQEGDVEALSLKDTVDRLYEAVYGETNNNPDCDPTVSCKAESASDLRRAVDTMLGLVVAGVEEGDFGSDTEASSHAPTSPTISTSTGNTADPSGISGSSGFRSGILSVKEKEPIFPARFSPTRKLLLQIQILSFLPEFGWDEDRLLQSLTHREKEVEENGEGEPGAVPAGGNPSRNMSRLTVRTGFQKGNGQWVSNSIDDHTGDSGVVKISLEDVDQAGCKDVLCREDVVNSQQARKRNFVSGRLSAGQNKVAEASYSCCCCRCGAQSALSDLFALRCCHWVCKSCWATHVQESLLLGANDDSLPASLGGGDAEGAVDGFGDISRGDKESGSEGIISCPHFGGCSKRLSPHALSYLCGPVALEAWYHGQIR